MATKRRRTMTDKDGFTLMEAGHWAKCVSNVDKQIRFDIVLVDGSDCEDGKSRWVCYRNNVPFDAGETLREAKGYCVEP